MSNQKGGPAAPESRAPEAPKQDLQAELEQLRATVARQDALLQQLQALQGQPATAKLPEPKEGYVWVYTRYAYVVEEFEGKRFRPRTVPKDTAIQVHHKELELDRLRRFPHLETAADREERLAQVQKKHLAPVQEQMDNVAAAFASANAMIEARELHRQATLKDLVSAERIAEQLPG